MSDETPRSESETKIKLHYGPNNEYEVTTDQLWAMLTKASVITGATVSVKEARWPVRSNGTEKFFSLPLDFTRVWTIVNSIPDPAQQDAGRRLALLAIQKEILETESWLQQLAMFALVKDNITPSWRNPENPAVQAGWDIQKYFAHLGLSTEGALRA